MHSKLTKFLCLQLQFIPDLSRFSSTNRQQTELLKKSNRVSISGSFRHVVQCQQEISFQEVNVTKMWTYPKNYHQVPLVPLFQNDHFSKIIISCLRYLWHNLEQIICSRRSLCILKQVSYDHFPKITISCWYIEISAKCHSFIIFIKLLPVAQGTPGAT